MTLQRTIRVDQPVSKVFAYLADFTTTEEWDAGTVRTTRVSGDGGIGTTYANTSRFMGRETELSYVVTDLQPEHKIALRGENKTVVSNDTMDIKPDGEGTELIYTVEFEFSGIAKYLEPLLKLPMKRFIDESEQTMRIALEKL